MPGFKPLFLIAMPQLGDPNFFHTVVLLIQKDEEGGMGFILNRVTDTTLGKFALGQKFPCHEDLQSVPVFFGGPVERSRGWILHTDSHVEERQEILPGIFLSASLESLKKLLAAGQKPLRLILGYSGWASKQLEKEMAEGTWIAAEAHPQHVLETPPNETWGRVLHEMGVDPTRLSLAPGVH